jgi:predicted secreted protein
MLQTSRLIRLLVFLSILVSYPMLVIAGEDAFYDRIQLSAQATAEVENDILVAILSAQRQGKQVGQLAEEVNQVMTKAIKRCKQSKGIEVQTLNYQTTPVYEKQRQTGWRVSQSLQLKSRDSKALSKLIGDLQDTLMMDSMRYEISPEQRTKIEESLIGQAIAAFSKRAQNITQHLNRKTYRLVSMQVNTGGYSAKPMSAQNFRGLAAAPVFEAGKQNITVTVSGVIELEKK